MAELGSISDVVDTEFEDQAIAKARAELAAGPGVVHERVREWLQKLAKGENVPPPTS